MVAHHHAKLELARRHDARKRRRRIFLTTALACLTAVTALVPQLLRTPYHNSPYTGMMWITELLNGHPDRMYDCLRMRAHVFKALVLFLRAENVVDDSRYMTLEEQLGIFLYICATGCGVRSAAERFQRGNATIA